MRKVVIGIDPGAHGALAIYYPHQGKILVENFTSEDEATETLRAVRDFCAEECCGCVAYLEQVGGFVKGRASPGSAMFNFGSNFGFWRGACRALRIELRLVRPQVWQKGVGLSAKLAGAARKSALKDAAARIYPDLKCTLANADALLILDWARREERN